MRDAVVYLHGIQQGRQHGAVGGHQGDVGQAVGTARVVGRRGSVVDGIQLHRLVPVHVPRAAAVVYVEPPLLPLLLLLLLVEVGEVQEVEVGRVGWRRHAADGGRVRVDDQGDGGVGRGDRGAQDGDGDPDVVGLGVADAACVSR